MVCCSTAGGKCLGNDARYNSPGWVALNFSLPDPYNYYPHFVATGTGAAAQFTADSHRRPRLRRHGLHLRPRRALIGATGDVTGGSAPAVTNELE